MADATFQPYPDSTGKKIDLTSLTVGADTVYRERVNIGDPSGATALAAVTAKGTQGGFALQTQDLKDAGRQSVSLIWESLATSTTESTLTNFTAGQRGGSALGAATNYQVSSGKTLRLQAINALWYAGSTAPTAPAILRIRVRQAATVANTSPIIWQGTIGVPSAMTAAASYSSSWSDIPEGLEVAAAQQITVTVKLQAAGGTGTTTDVVVVGYEY
jgi:hypothetical protein